jgi:hypothetical protein
MANFTTTELFGWASDEDQEDGGYMSSSTLPSSADDSTPFFDRRQSDTYNDHVLRRLNAQYDVREAMTRLQIYTASVSFNSRFTLFPWLHTTGRGEQMFAPIQWSKLKKFHKFDFEAWRRVNNVTRFSIVDSRGANFETRLSNPVVQSFRRRKWTAANTEFRMVPELCCDRAQRSLCWAPMDVPVRPAVHSYRVCLPSSQPIFADFICDRSPVVLHPLRQMRSYYHGVNNQQSPIATQENKKGCCLLAAIAAAVVDVWLDIMAYLTVNEKAVYAHCFSDRTCADYGVNLMEYHRVKPAWNVLSTPLAITFVVGPQLMGSVHKRMKFTPGAAWEQRRAEWARERRSELEWLKTSAFESKKTPLGLLSHYRTVYDLTNFTNRHGVRVTAVGAFLSFMTDQMVDGVLRCSERLGRYASTHFIQEDPIARALFTAKHTVEHVEYMTAWVDLGEIVNMSLDINIPLDNINTKKLYHVKLGHDGVACHVDEKEVEMSKGEEDKMWHDWRDGATAHMSHHVGRLATLDRLATTYCGKSLSYLLDMYAEQDCALYADLGKVLEYYKWGGSSSGGVLNGVVNQFAVQLSNAFSGDTKMLHDHVLRHSYQSMNNVHTPGADCGETCQGCFCPASLKATAWAAYENASFCLEAVHGSRAVGVCLSRAAQVCAHEQRCCVRGASGTVRFSGQGVVQGLADILSGYGVCASETPYPFNLSF